MADSGYVILDAEKSFCKHCTQPVSLLQHVRNGLALPQFYICWNCNKVFEVGKGEVTDLDE